MWARGVTRALRDDGDGNWRQQHKDFERAEKKAKEAVSLRCSGDLGNGVEQGYSGGAFTAAIRLIGSDLQPTCNHPGWLGRKTSTIRSKC